MAGVVLQSSNLGFHEFDHAANPERLLSHYCGDGPLDVIYIEGRSRVRVVSAKLPEGLGRDTTGQEDQAIELYYWDPDES